MIAGAMMSNGGVDCAMFITGDSATGMGECGAKIGAIFVVVGAAGC